MNSDALGQKLMIQLNFKWNIQNETNIDTQKHTHDQQHLLWTSGKKLMYNW